MRIQRAAFKANFFSFILMPLLEKLSYFKRLGRAPMVTTTH